MDLLEGLVLTHRVTEEERAASELDADPDLGVLGELAGDDERIPLLGGGYLEDRYVALVGPIGWIPGGDQVLLRVVRADERSAGAAGRLAVAVEPLDELPLVDVALADLLAEVFDELVEDPPVDTIDVILGARGRDPAFLSAAAAPLEDLLAVAGLYDDGGRTYRVGEGPEAFDDGDDLVDHLELDHGFDHATIRDVLLVANAVLRTGSEVLRSVTRELAGEPGHARDDTSGSDGVTPSAIDDEVAGALVSLVADPDTSFALLHDVVGSDPLAAATLLGMIDRVPADLDRRGRANRHWVRAELLEFVAEDHTDAEEELRRAVELDPHHGPASFALARYRSDRGDARGALDLLRSFELLDEDRPWVALLERFARPRQAAAGRNDPCPCGSRRKYKRCCADRVGWSLEERRDWVFDKLIRFATSPATLEAAEELALAAGLDAAEEVWHDDFLANLLLFDAGTVADFVERRSPLLPADERGFLAVSAGTRASLYEVTGTEPDAGRIVVLDHRDGERLEVIDRTMSAQLSAGDLFLGWFAPGPSGRTQAVEGGIVIPGHARASAFELMAADPDAYDLAAWYAALTAPPTLLDRDGDPLVMVSAVHSVPDPEAAAAALTEALGSGRQEAGGTIFDVLEPEDDLGAAPMVGTVTLHRDQLVTFALSEAKSDRVRELVAGVVPDAELIEVARPPVADILRGAGTGAGGGTAPDDGPREPDPGTRAELDEVAADYLRHGEEQWLDMDVPALGGLTPRQAAADPTRRGDLERLLRGFEGPALSTPPSAASMDVERLRLLLGL